MASEVPLIFGAVIAFVLFISIFGPLLGLGSWMMGPAYGMGGWMYGFPFLGLAICLLLIVALILFIMWLVQQLQQGEKRHGSRNS